MSGKRAFTQAEIRRIETFIRGCSHSHALRDFAALRLGVDSLLRVSDMLAMNVGDVLGALGEVRRAFKVRQGKTGSDVACEIGDKTIQAISAYLESREPYGTSEPLFPGRKGTGKSITPEQWRRLLKGYCEAVGIETSDISTHSIRKTVPTLLYERSGGNVRACQILLGHKSLAHTEKYLSISERQAFDLKAMIEI